MDAGNEFNRLVQIMRRLRRECPWDRSQSHDSLRPYLLEETYEVLHLLDAADYDELREELGDLMLQIVFHAEIAEEAGRFDVADVLSAINRKLVRRHPHVFGDREARTPCDVSRRWEVIKAEQERKESALDGVPAELPALVKAARVLAKMRQCGLDPFRESDPLGEARRHLEQFAEAAGTGREQGRARSALAMLLLSVAALADEAGLGAEDALRGAVRRLSNAYRAEEAAVRASGGSFADLPPEELRELAGRVLDAAGEG